MQFSFFNLTLARTHANNHLHIFGFQMLLLLWLFHIFEVTKQDT